MISINKRYFLFTSIFFLLFQNSCFLTFDKGKNEKLLNEKLEQERIHKEKINRLERENKVLFHRNLDLDKTKKLLTIQLKNKNRDYKNLSENYEKDKKAFNSEKKNLEEKIVILNEKGEKQIARLLNNHKKQKEELEKKIRTQRTELSDKIKVLLTELDRKEKNWTNLEFSYKKEQRRLEENIQSLEKKISDLMKDIREREEKQKELMALLQKKFKNELKSGDVILGKELNPEIKINNQKIYKNFQAGWKKEGEKFVKIFFAVMSENQALMDHFSIKVSVYTSSRWMDRGFRGEQMANIPIGPPSRDKIISSEKRSASLKHQWNLAKEPFPVALSALRVWRWEDFFYEYLGKFKDFSLAGIPKPSLFTPWDGATILTFVYKTKNK